MADRLTSLDGSFLRVETPNAHMHVAWSGVFEPRAGVPRPNVDALRAKLAGRLGRVPRFRQRLAYPPLGSPSRDLVQAHRAPGGHGRAARRDRADARSRQEPGCAHRLQRARVSNLAISNIPGPRFPLYMLGAELAEAYRVVPLGAEHALSVGMFSYRDHLFFGLYADPEVLPEVHELPALLNVEILALSRPRRRALSAGPGPALREAASPQRPCS